MLSLFQDKNIIVMFHVQHNLGGGGGGGGNKLDIFMPENVNLVLLMADQSLCIFSQSPKKFNPAH